MAKIIWAPSALDDLDSIAEFISRDSPDRASLFIDRIIEQSDKLENNPLLGRVIPEMGKTCAENYCMDHIELCIKLLMKRYGLLMLFMERVILGLINNIV